MYNAIYVSKITHGTLKTYQEAWRTLSSFMTSKRGAVGSKIYSNLSQNKVIIHSTWPNFENKQASWPLPEGSDPKLTKAAEAMKNCRVGNPISLTLPTERIETFLKEEGIQFEPIEQIQSQRKDILIYNDDGVGVNSAYETMDTLRRIIDTSLLKIKIVDSKYINEIDWQDTTRLFIIPGGRARPYYTKLGTIWEADTVEKGKTRIIKEIGKGNIKIKKFVMDGGNFLGICAGAYYGAELTVFEKGGKWEVLDEGALNFYKGVAEGPAYGLGRFQYNSDLGSEQATISSDKLCGANDLRVYFNGGCYLHDYDSDNATSEQHLGVYTNIVKDAMSNPSGTYHPAAIVEINNSKHVGIGKAILSGAHFEIMSTSPKIDSEMQAFLAPQDKERLHFAATIVSRFGIPLNNKYHQLIYGDFIDVKANVQKYCTDKEAFKFENLQVIRQHFSEIESTQSYSQKQEELNKLVNEPNKWLIISADRQTGGVGTGGRKWSSPDGNIYTTISYFESEDNPHFKNSNLPQIVALSIVQTLKSFGIHNSTLKWVNDVLVGDKKISGILCQESKVAGKLVRNIGVGINVNMTQIECERILQPATSMSLQLENKKINKHEVAFALEHILHQNITLFAEHGFVYFLEKLNNLLAYKDEVILFDRDANSQGENKVFAAMVRGLDITGKLVIHPYGATQSQIFANGRILRGKEAEPHQHLLANIKKSAATQPHSSAFSFLKPQNVADSINFKRIAFDIIDSTQTFCHREGLQLFSETDCVVVTAKEQTKGRGTLIERKWVSPANVGVYATFALILPNDSKLFQNMQEQPVTVQIASLAVVKTLEKFGFKPQLKWRNDVLIDGKKISGVLCQPLELADGRKAGLAGIGINVNTPESELSKVVDQKVTSMMMESNIEYNVDEVFLELQKQLTHYIKLYLARGYQPCKQEVLAKMAYVGEQIEVEETDAQSKNPQRLVGIHKGLDEVGRLVLDIEGTDKVITYGRIVKQHEQQLLTQETTSKITTLGT